MFAPSKLLTMTAGLALLALTSTTSVSAQCDLPTSYKWTPSGQLAVPTSSWYSFNDMAHAMYNGKHLVIGSSNSRYFGAMKFGLFGNWTDMATAEQRGLKTVLAVTPTLFQFGPKNTWVLAYKGASSLTYRTSSDPSDTDAWSDEKTLFSGKIAGSIAGPTDPALIGDSKNMHLFFTANDGKVYRSSMPIGNFPGDFGAASTVVLSGSTNDVAEAVQVYTVKGQNKYLMIVEAIGVNGRYSRSFTATTLDAQWTPQAATEAAPFAGKANADLKWSKDVSHADIIRSNPDQTMTIDACNLQVLVQGEIPGGAGSGITPFRPATLTLQK